MNPPATPQKAPYKLSVEAGKKYAWCACGLSKNQPLCDGSHKGSGHVPIIYTAQNNEDVWFCGCKQSNAGALCDGTHNGL
jgi:CDGSH-type Zn-finger protein